MAAELRVFTKCCIVGFSPVRLSMCQNCGRDAEPIELPDFAPSERLDIMLRRYEAGQASHAQIVLEIQKAGALKLTHFIDQIRPLKSKP